MTVKVKTQEAFKRAYEHALCLNNRDSFPQELKDAKASADAIVTSRGRAFAPELEKFGSTYSYDTKIDFKGVIINLRTYVEIKRPTSVIWITHLGYCHFNYAINEEIVDNGTWYTTHGLYAQIKREIKEALEQV